MSLKIPLKTKGINLNLLLKLLNKNRIVRVKNAVNHYQFIHICHQSKEKMLNLISKIYDFIY